MNDFLDARSMPIQEHGNSRLEIKRFGIDILPIDLSSVKGVVDAQYRQNFEPIYYTTTRGVDELLTGKRDYARLPDLPGKPAIQIFRDAKPNSTLLDVGCGSGTFIKELLTKVNPNLQAYGFDSRTWEEQEELQRLTLGNIDDLPKVSFDGVSKFDLVTCASVLYHLPDYWGAIQRMADRLKPNGILLTSTIPKVVGVDIRDSDISYGEAVDDTKGNFKYPDNGRIGYYRSRNIFDVDGKLVPMADLIHTLNMNNPNHKLRYSVTPAENIGAQQYGGQISIVRESEQPLNLSNLYYCSHSIDRDFGGISYILGKNPKEIDKLRGSGYRSVQERLS